MFSKHLEENGEKIVSKIKAIYKFDILENKNEPPTISWVVDLKNGKGSIKKAEGNEKVDVTMTITKEDMMGLVNKTLHPQKAVMLGKMKIRGNVAAAMRFSPELLPVLPKL